MELDGLPAWCTCPGRMTSDGFAVMQVQSLSRRTDNEMKSGSVCQIRLSLALVKGVNSESRMRSIRIIGYYNRHDGMQDSRTGNGVFY